MSDMRFLTTVTVRNTIIWGVTPRGPVEFHRLFIRNVMLPFSRSVIFHALLFNPEDGNSRALRDVGELVPDYTASRSSLLMPCIFCLNKSWKCLCISILGVNRILIYRQGYVTGPIYGVRKAYVTVMTYWPYLISLTCSVRADLYASGGDASGSLCYHGRTSSVSKVIMKYSGSELLHGPLCRSLFGSSSGIGNWGEREEENGRETGKGREMNEAMKREKKKEGDG